MFKLRGHTLFLEVCATAKEIMLFDDNGFVMFRFACMFNWQSVGGPYYDVSVDWKVACIPQLAALQKINFLF